MRINAFAEIPAVPAALSLCGGIVAGYFLLAGIPSVWIWITAFLFVIIAVIIWLLISRVFAFAIFTLLIGCFLGRSSGHEALPSHLVDTSGTFTGKVVKAERSANDLRAVIEVKSWKGKTDSVAEKTNFRILCVFKNQIKDIVKGSKITASGKLKDVSYEPDIPYELNYNRFLFIDGVVGRVTVYGDDTDVNNSEVSSLQKFMNGARSRWLEAIARAGFNEPTTYFLLAVIGGEDILLSDSIEEQFRQTGLSHILAISGLHVGIILSALLLLLYPIKLVRRLRPLYFVLPAILIIFYAFVTGGSPSAIRAATMCCIVLGNRAFEIRTNGLQSLAVAVIAVLCFKPLWIFLPGFQFSVCAVLGILAFAPLFDIVPRRFNVFHTAWTAFLLPVVAVSGTLVLTIYYFHNFAINFWLSNIIAAILVPAILLIGFLATLLSLVGFCSNILAWAGDKIYALMAKTITIFANMLPQNTVDLYLGTGSLIAITLIIVAFAWLVRNYSHIRGIIILFLSIVAIFGIVIFTGGNSPNSELYIPRHNSSTDILIVHQGKSYIWTTARSNIDKTLLQQECAVFYKDFYKRRNLKYPSPIIADTFSEGELMLKKNILTLDTLTLARIDNDSCLPSGHVDIALISDLYRGDIHELVKHIDADTILLSPAINYMTHGKFIRQLDTLNVNYKDLRDKGLAWQFN